MAIGRLDSDLSRIRRILVVQLCPIGDTLFGTPAIKALRQRFPNARMVSLVWPVSCEVVFGNPNLDEVIVYQGSVGKILRRLRKERFDLVVELSNRGGWLTPFVGARYNIGFRSRTLRWFYAVSGSVQKDIHAVDYCLDVVRPLGAVLESPQMEIFVEQGDSDKALRVLRDAGITGSDVLVAMHPGGKYFPAKRWNSQGFAEVADMLHERYGAKIAIVGGSEDEELGKRIEQGLKLAKVVNLIGKVSIKQTASVIQRANLFIGNDSSPMHMAVAVGTPVVALFGPTNPLNSKPYGNGHVCIFKQVECSPCFHHLGSPVQYCPKCIRHECMEAISVDDVYRAAVAQLEQNGCIKSDKAHGETGSFAEG